MQLQTLISYGFKMAKVGTKYVLLVFQLIHIGCYYEIIGYQKMFDE